MEPLQVKIKDATKLLSYSYVEQGELEAWALGGSGASLWRAFVPTWSGTVQSQRLSRLNQTKTRCSSEVRIRTSLYEHDSNSQLCQLVSEVTKVVR